jgi:phage protein D
MLTTSGELRLKAERSRRLSRYVNEPDCTILRKLAEQYDREAELADRLAMRSMDERAH